MKEYIEREKLRKLIKEDIEICGDVDSNSRPVAYGAKLGFMSALSYVNTMPAADIEKVRHGKWNICCDGYYPYCSECDYEPPYVNDKDMRTPYCPHCGAKMDENVHTK